MKKRLLILSVFILAIAGMIQVWYVHIHFRFEEISPNKVYKSGLIDPDKLESFLIPNKIKTVINLLDPGVKDRLNPGQMAHIDKENSAIELINEKHGTDIRHVNIPSGQVPSRETLTKFFEVLDDKLSYPVLIHCYHGTGRAVIYSALYRIEYENWKSEDARMQTRALGILVESPFYRSSFAQGKSKGDFLINYTARIEGNNSTFNQLK